MSSDTLQESAIPMSDNALPSTRKRAVWKIVPLLLVLFAAGGGGYYWWSQQSSAHAASEEKPVPEPDPVFMPLDTFTVNLLNSGNSLDRVLYVGFTLRLPDEATKERMTHFLPEVRSRLLIMLSRQTAETLTSEAGKQQLISEIKQVLSPPLVKNEPHQVVSDVLFTAFILR